LLGGLDKSLHPGDRVMIKPNFNCAYRSPLSTDMGILKTVIEILLDYGAKVSIGESSGRGAGPTAGVIKDLDLLNHIKRYDVDFINFDEDRWVEVEVPGEYWSSITVPRSIYEAEKRINLSNMRCHSSARFSASLKLIVGCISSQDRDYLHEDKDTTEFKVAELNLAWQPDLNILDGRRTTVSWHGRGEYFYPNILMASGNMVALDIEAVKELKKFPAENRIDMPIDELGQIATAIKHNLGSLDYELICGEPHSETEQKGNTDPAAIAVLMDIQREKEVKRLETQLSS
jgi:uncharacterized protein (DUF362 family)